MTQPATEQPPFYCPECGHKHRADLSGLVGHPGAHAKVTCHRCGTTLKLHVAPDGMPICERAGEALAGLEDEPAQHAPAPSAQASLATPPRGGGSQIGALLLALLAGAAGGVGAGQLLPAAGGEKEAAPAPSGLSEAAARALIDQAIQTRSARSATEMASMLEALRGEWNTLRTQMADLSAKVAALPAPAAAAGQSPELEAELKARLEAGLRSLNGRIEANYQAIKALDQRMEALVAGQK